MKPLRFSAMALIPAMLLALPSRVQGQEECTGAYCNYSGAGNNHWFSGMTCSTGGGCKNCNDAPENHIGCHAPDAPGECSTHAGCDLSFYETQSAVLAAVKAGDMAAITRLLQGSRYFFSSRRTALQGRDCKGSVVFHVPLTPEIASAILTKQVLAGINPQLRGGSSLAELIAAR